MGVEKEILEEGNGQDFPKKGDLVTIQYTGNLLDPGKADKRGAEYEYTEAGEDTGWLITGRFDSSRDRGDFKTQIGVGKVIKGWDEGVTKMSLGEKAFLTISADFAYGDRGFPGLIPANSALIFEVHLKAINDKKAA